MTELTTEERLANLRARGRATTRDAAPTTSLDAFGETGPIGVPSREAPPTTRSNAILSHSVASDVGPPDGWRPVPARAEGLRIVDSVSRNTSWQPDVGWASIDWLPNWSSSRVAAAAASIVSFAAIAVSMGPILENAEGEGDEANVTNLVAGGETPGAPAVEIQTSTPEASVLETVPAPVDGAPVATEEGTAQPADPAAPADTAPPAAPTADDATAPTAAPATDAPTTAPPTAAAPTTAPPAGESPTTAAPAPTTAPPATQATTAPPTTAAPTTAPLSTAPPTTAAPTTVAPTTAPPRSEGSG